jgi:DNA-binding HxlR family transcriptional regulator
MTRSYGQLCGLALALDQIGDRWSLLIVRELLVRPDGARYTDLRDGLPGIATNLLADRLRDLEAVGVVRRDLPRPPVATPLFRLTERGKALRPAVDALAIWGGAAVPAADKGGEFRTRWMVLPVEAMLADRQPDQPGVAIELRTGDEPLRIEIGDGSVRARAGVGSRAAELVIAGPPKAVLGVMSGALPTAAAVERGVEISGDRSVLTRVGLR